MYVGRSVGLSRFIILSGSLIETVGAGVKRGGGVGWLC